MTLSKLSLTFRYLGPSDLNGFAPKSARDHLNLVIANIAKMLLRIINFIFGDHHLHSNRSANALIHSPIQTNEYIEFADRHFKELKNQKLDNTHSYADDIDQATLTAIPTDFSPEYITSSPLEETTLPMERNESESLNLSPDTQISATLPDFLVNFNLPDEIITNILSFCPPSFRLVNSKIDELYPVRLNFKGKCISLQEFEQTIDCHSNKIVSIHFPKNATRKHLEYVKLKCPHLKALNINDSHIAIKDLYDLHKFFHLNTLNFNGIPLISENEVLDLPREADVTDEHINFITSHNQNLKSITVASGKITHASLSFLQRLRHLQSLEFHLCDQITLNHVFSHKWNLKSLEYNWVALITQETFFNLRKESTDDYLDFVTTHNPSLTALHINASKITNDGISYLLRLKQLKILHLIDCPQLTAMHVLSGLNHLECLFVDGDFTESGLLNISYLKSLKLLSFRQCPIVTADRMIKLSPLSNLSDISICDCSSFVDLESIELSAETTDQDFQFITILYEKLKTITFNSSKITNRAMKYLLRLTHLQSLKFIKCPQITAIAQLSFIRHLKNFVLNNISLITEKETFILPKEATNEYLYFITTRNPNLKCLLINASKITNKGIPFLLRLRYLQDLQFIKCPQINSSKQLSHAKHLRSLILNGVSLISENEKFILPQDSTDEYLDFIISRNPQLITLCIKGRNITDAGLSKISELKNLKKLHIISCPLVTLQGLKSLPLSTLSGLKIKDCPMFFDLKIIELPEEATDLDLRSIVLLYPNLKSLTLNGPQISEKRLNYISVLRKLEILNWKGCPREFDFLTLQNHRPKLKIFLS